MARNNNHIDHANDAASGTHESPDASAWLGDEIEQSSLPRWGIGDGSDGKSLAVVQGTYLATQYEYRADDRDGVVKRRLLHRVRPSDATGPADDVLLWGGYQLDHALPTLPPGTKFQASYEGMGTSARGQLKHVKVLYPAGTSTVPNPWFDADDNETGSIEPSAQGTK